MDYQVFTSIKIAGSWCQPCLNAVCLVGLVPLPLTAFTLHFFEQNSVPSPPCKHRISSVLQDTDSPYETLVWVGHENGATQVSVCGSNHHTDTRLSHDDLLFRLNHNICTGLYMGLMRRLHWNVLTNWRHPMRACFMQHSLEPFAK